VGEGAFICRAGLIVGPEDPTGRFTYWPARLARGGEVLVSGTPDDAVQLIDVRDLAQWIVHAAQTGLTGTFDGIGPSFTRGQFLAECAEAVRASFACTWVDRAFLESQGIKRWGRRTGGDAALAPADGPRHRSGQPDYECTAVSVAAPNVGW
jgi:2'-hydroxyisoflavone reductase